MTRAPAAPAAAAALLASATASAATAHVRATVGPGDKIMLKIASGAALRTPKAGTYTLVVCDRADDNNIHLRGFHLNRSTRVAWNATAVWKDVRFARGMTYRVQCDPHDSDMLGSFRAR